MPIQSNQSAITRSKDSLLATHSVLRNTYFLLSLTLLFSAGMAAFAMAHNAQPFGLVLTLVGFFGLYYLTFALRNSAWGIVATFAFTGFLGYSLGPILNLYLHNFANGGQLIMTALGATGAIFLCLSAYVLVTRKDFSYLGGFLFAAIMVAFVVGIAGVLFHSPMLQLVISGAFALLSSGMILFYTSQIIQGGETNYILATVSLYVALFNLFTSLLSILGAFGGNRD